MALMTKVKLELPVPRWKKKKFKYGDRVQIRGWRKEYPTEMHGTFYIEEKKEGMRRIHVLVDNIGGLSVPVQFVRKL